VIGRLVLALAIAGPWWVIVLAILTYFFLGPSWAANWWGPYVFGATYMLVFSLCYKGLIIHERKLLEQGGRPVRLPDWSIKWVVAGIVVFIAGCVIYAMHSA